MTINANNVSVVLHRGFASPRLAYYYTTSFTAESGGRRCTSVWLYESVKEKYLPEIRVVSMSVIYMYDIRGLCLPACNDDRA